MIANIIIVAVVALIFGLCLRKVISGMKHGGGCSGCTGNCAGCHQCPSTPSQGSAKPHN